MIVEADGGGGGSIIRRPLRREDLDVVLPPLIILISPRREDLERYSLPKPVLIALPLLRRL
jgi:hypothetical protein